MNFSKGGTSRILWDLIYYVDHGAYQIDINEFDHETMIEKLTEEHKICIYPFTIKYCLNFHNQSWSIYPASKTMRHLAEMIYCKEDISEGDTFSLVDWCHLKRVGGKEVIFIKTWNSRTSYESAQNLSY